MNHSNRLRSVASAALIASAVFAAPPAGARSLRVLDRVDAAARQQLGVVRDTWNTSRRRLLRDLDDILAEERGEPDAAAARVAARVSYSMQCLAAQAEAATVEFQKRARATGESGDEVRPGTPRSRVDAFSRRLQRLLRDAAATAERATRSRLRPFRDDSLPYAVQIVVRAPGIAPPAIVAGSPRRRSDGVLVVLAGNYRYRPSGGRLHVAGIADVDATAVEIVVERVGLPSDRVLPDAPGLAPMSRLMTWQGTVTGDALSEDEDVLSSGGIPSGRPVGIGASIRDAGGVRLADGSFASCCIELPLTSSARPSLDTRAPAGELLAALPAGFDLGTAGAAAHRFKLTAARRVRLTATIAPDSSDPADLALRLRAVAGGAVLATDDDSGPGTAPSFVADLAPDVEYELVVAAWPGSVGAGNVRAVLGAVDEP